MSVGPEDTTGLPCASCGYALDGLAPDGVCPECASPIRLSIDAARTPRPGSHTRRLERGLILAAVGSGASLATVATLASASWTPEREHLAVALLILSASVNAWGWTLVAFGVGYGLEAAGGVALWAWAVPATALFGWAAAAAGLDDSLWPVASVALLAAQVVKSILSVRAIGLVESMFFNRPRRSWAWLLAGSSLGLALALKHDAAVLLGWAVFVVLLAVLAARLRRFNHRPCP